MWQVVINNVVIKEYKHKLQAYIYLHLHGYIWYGKGWLFKDKSCEVRYKHPKYITLLRGKYMVQIDHKYIGIREKIEDAIKLRDSYLEKRNGKGC